MQTDAQVAVLGQAYDRKAEGREFRALMLRTVLPLLIQSLFMQSLTFVDQLMVSSLGKEAIAAVGSVNKLMSLYNSFLYGSCSGCAMFMAQYWGRRDIRSFKSILSVTLAATVGAGVLVTALGMVFAEPLVGIFDSNPLVVRQGSLFLRVVAPSYFLYGIVFPLNFSLRSMNRVRVTMAGTMMAMGINVLASYLLIYGKFGFPRLGVAGAAAATLLARVVELAYLLVYFKASRSPVMRNVREFFRLSKVFAGSFVQKALPLIGNEMMWSLGTTAYFIIYGRSGTDALAAMSIMQTLQMLSKIFSSSFNGASAIIVGNEIGAGDEPRVMRICGRFHVTSLIVGALSGVMVFALAGVVPRLFQIEGSAVGGYVVKCMGVLAVYIVMNTYNSINIEGIFRSGGDVRFITFADMGSIWMVGMPVTVLLGLVLRMDIVFVYGALLLVELYKLPLVFSRYRSGKWLHRLHEIRA